MLINSGANRIYIILAYIKCWGFALRYKREPYSLNTANRILIVYNKELVDQETYKLKLRLRLYWELILFNIINIKSSDIILEFL